MRIVLDTNVFIATLITPHANIARLYWLWREGSYTLLTSRTQLDELRDVSRRPKFLGIIRPYQAGAMVNTLKVRAELVRPRTILDISPDPDDNLILAIALEGDADFLALLDLHDVVRLNKVGKTRILHARDLLDRLG